METQPNLNKPWMVAVWPGMGQVALSAGYYLMAKLQMNMFAELRALDLFDVEHVEVKQGIVQAGSLPRSRLFVWNDPAGRRDIVVFIGEAQPPMGKYAFCRRLIEVAQELGVERLFTFASMATEARPKDPSRVFVAATEQKSLSELQTHSLEMMEDGHIGGLNGVLLGVAVEEGLPGACLLGEMPLVFARIPFPKASLAVLDVFTQIAGIEVDLAELREQADAIEEKLDGFLTEMERAMEEPAAEGEEVYSMEEPEDRLDPAEKRRIERLFEQARKDRSKAYELKRELDRLSVFDEYEDRFLDLFKKVE